MISFFFFFSSRRRHTRCSRDWSSDVCSSDLLWLLALSVALGVALGATGLREKLFRKSDATTIRSLAVLPLENLSHDPEQEYFADGMTEALTTELAQIGTLKVISRTSVMQYKRTK